MATDSAAPSSTGNEYRDEEDDTVDAFCATSIHASLATLLQSEKYSDMTISCGGRDFKAHRAIVCTQSSFFDRAMSSNFKVSYRTHARQGRGPADGYPFTGSYFPRRLTA